MEKSQKRSNSISILQTDVIKLLLSITSVYLLYQCIFGKDHEVLSFYRSLFMLSYPLSLEITEKLIEILDKYNNDIHCNKKSFITVAISWFFSSVCVIFTLIALFTSDKFEKFYRHIHENEYWGFATIFIFLFSICFLLYSVGKVVKPLLLHKEIIQFEERP